MTVRIAKRSHTVACSSGFRDAVTALAAAHQVNAADLARSVLLLLPVSVIDSYPDPGEPDADDRETVILKSGASKGRPWRRKPRLQLRLPFSVSADRVRRSLSIALALAGDELNLALEKRHEAAHRDAKQTEKIAAVERTARSARDEAETLRGEVERLRAIVTMMISEALPNGIKTRADALYVMGFPPGRLPDARTVKARFRQLATIHHPDSDLGDHQRMSQLNAAMALLQRGGI